LSLLLGAVVIVLHGSAFPYFIMTAGLFPALALSMAAGKPLAMAGRSAWPIVVGLVLFCCLQSIWESVEMLDDTQKEQRDTLRLVYESPLRDRRGFHLEGALFCMRDPEPFEVLFSPGIWRRFYASAAAMQNRSRFMDEFRKRPVAYVVETYRLAQFPQDIRDFLSLHYIWYSHSLYVAGYNLLGAIGAVNVDVLVPGKYRWDPDPSSKEARLHIDSIELSPGDTIELTSGQHQAQPIGEGARGQLILADLPKPVRDGYPYFYHRRQIAQLGGYR
jgi:hypothetical protein